MLILGLSPRVLCYVDLATEPRDRPSESIFDPGKSRTGSGLMSGVGVSALYYRSGHGSRLPTVKYRSVVARVFRIVGVFGRGQLVSSSRGFFDSEADREFADVKEKRSAYVIHSKIGVKRSPTSCAMYKSQNENENEKSKHVSAYVSRGANELVRSPMTCAMCENQNRNGGEKSKVVSPIGSRGEKELMRSPLTSERCKCQSEKDLRFSCSLKCSQKSYMYSHLGVGIVRGVRRQAENDKFKSHMYSHPGVGRALRVRRQAEEQKFKSERMLLSFEVDYDSLDRRSGLRKNFCTVTLETFFRATGCGGLGTGNFEQCGSTNVRKFSSEAIIGSYVQRLIPWGMHHPLATGVCVCENAQEIWTRELTKLHAAAGSNAMRSTVENLEVSALGTSDALRSHHKNLDVIALGGKLHGIKSRLGGYPKGCELGFIGDLESANEVRNGREIRTAIHEVMPYAGHSIFDEQETGTVHSLAVKTWDERGHD